MSGLDDFISAILLNAGAQAELGFETDREQFSQLASALASRLGFSVAADDILKRLLPDPLGLDTFDMAAPNCQGWPPPGWLPIGVSPFGPEPVIEWGWFGNHRADAPFYFDTARLVRTQPLTRLLRPRTGLSNFIKAASGPVPDALIFHMSRCGSTLVHRMLAESGAVLSLSEPAPLDAILEFCAALPPLMQVAALRAMAAALGRQAGGRYFSIKLDGWHVLAWPLFRQAFANAKAIFLFREPRAVLASQLQERGLQTVPQPRFAALYGIDDWQNIPGDEFCARGLAAVCQAGLMASRSGEMLAVDYKTLPQAAGHILDQFAFKLDHAAQRRMHEAALLDAKTPYQAFTPRPEPKSDLKQCIDILASRYLDYVYRGLRSVALEKQEAGPAVP